MGKKSIHGTGERFRRIANELFDGNKSELARSLGMQPSSFAKYTDGSRRPGSKVLKRLSRMGVNINWFLSGKGRMMNSSNSEGASDSDSTSDGGASTTGTESVGASTESSVGHFFRIPVIQIRKDETDRWHLEETGAVQKVSAPFVRQRYGVDPAQLREFRVSGNAMESTIRPGDRLLVAVGEGASLVDGEICLVSSPNGVMVRRVSLRGTDVVLVADNESVSDQEIDREQWRDAYRPLARILEVLRPL